MPESNVRTAALRRAAGDLIQSPIPDDELVDVAGEVAKVTRDLTEFVRNLKSEMAPAAVGKSYQATESRSAKRSYNTQGLLAKFVASYGDAYDETTTVFTALQVLMDLDVVRLTWRWTELQNAAIEFDVPLTIVRHEIEDGDPDADVGEVWSSSTSVGGKTDD